MCAEPRNASTLCRRVATNAYLVDIHAAAQPVKSIACHVLSLSASRSYQRLQKGTAAEPTFFRNDARTTTATFAIVLELARLPQPSLNVDTSSTLIASKTK